MKLRKYFFLALFVYSLEASTSIAKYDVEFGIFGKIGEANLIYSHSSHEYKIHVEAYLTGGMASFANGRKEIYESMGIISDGILIPMKYTKRRVTNNSDELKSYLFDHNKKEVIKSVQKKKRVTKNSYDIATMRFDSREEILKSESSEKLNFYVKNDILSLFFNVKNILKDIHEGEEKSVYAVGGNKKDGKILIINPSGEKRSELESLMPENFNNLISVVIDQDIFKSERGELYINFNRDFFVKEAILQDVLLFGDIHGKKVFHKEN